MIALGDPDKKNPKAHTLKMLFRDSVEESCFAHLCKSKSFVVVDSLFAVLLLFVGDFVFSPYFVM